MAESITLTTEQQIEVVSLYSSTAARIDAVASAPGWQVFGAFPMPTSARVRLSAAGLVSDVSLALSVRLYRVDVPGVVPGSVVQITDTIDVEKFSTFFDLPAGLYQMQAQVVGNAGSSYYGSVRRAAPTG